MPQVVHSSQKAQIADMREVPRGKRFRHMPRALHTTTGISALHHSVGAPFLLALQTILCACAATDAYPHLPRNLSRTGGVVAVCIGLHCFPELKVPPHADGAGVLVVRTAPTARRASSARCSGSGTRWEWRGVAHLRARSRRQGRVVGGRDSTSQRKQVTRQLHFCSVGQGSRCDTVYGTSTSTQSPSLS
jgi:hypothetical protein